MLSLQTCPADPLDCKGTKKNVSSRLNSRFSLDMYVIKLLHSDEVIVLLTLLCQQILAVDQVLGSNGTVLVG